MICVLKLEKMYKKLKLSEILSRKLRLTKALHFHQLMADAKDMVSFTKYERNEANITTLLKKYDEIIGEVKNYENTIKSLKINQGYGVKRSSSALGHIIMNEYENGTHQNSRFLYRSKHNPIPARKANSFKG